MDTNLKLISLRLRYTIALGVLSSLVNVVITGTYASCSHGLWSGVITLMLVTLVLFFFIVDFIRPVSELYRGLKSLTTGNLILPDTGNSFLLAPIHELQDRLLMLVGEVSSIVEGKHNGPEVPPPGEGGAFADLLLKLRSRFSELSANAQERNWVRDGLALVSESVRKQYDSEAKFGDAILQLLIRYVKANQGILFVVRGEGEDAVLELLSCYAWERKKIIQKTINPGEGLIGQTWLEREPVFLTEVPPNFVKITSGLGDACPRSVYIVPLMVEDRVFGLIEIASFEVFTHYERDFVTKASNIVATALKAIVDKERNEKLLSESLALTEQLRAQDEELRQTVEEMRTTQEEMQNKTREIEVLLARMHEKNREVEVLKEDQEKRFKEVNEHQGRAVKQLLDSIRSKDQELDELRKFRDRTINSFTVAKTSSN